MAAKQKTPEEIQAMEDEVRAYRADEAQKKAEDQRGRAKPLLDVVETDGFKALEEAIPALEDLANDRDTFPYLRDHVAAVRNGLFGLRQTASGFTPPTALAEVPAQPAA